MTVLRSHLNETSGDWPVHRGLERLAEMLRRGDDTLALLCACGDGRTCHRSIVARALNETHFAGALRLREICEKPVDK